MYLLRTRLRKLCVQQYRTKIHYFTLIQDSTWDSSRPGSNLPCVPHHTTPQVHYHTTPQVHYHTTSTLPHHKYTTTPHHTTPHHYTIPYEIEVWYGTPISVPWKKGNFSRSIYSSAPFPYTFTVTIPNWDWLQPTSLPKPPKWFGFQPWTCLMQSWIVQHLLLDSTMLIMMQLKSSPYAACTFT